WSERWRSPSPNGGRTTVGGPSDDAPRRPHFDRCLRPERARALGALGACAAERPAPSPRLPRSRLPPERRASPPPLGGGTVSRARRGAVLDGRCPPAALAIVLSARPFFGGLDARPVPSGAHL